MSILAIILLIVLGIFLFIVEFLLVPGVTVAGIGGAILMAVAVYSAYKTHGSAVGNYTLMATLILSVGLENEAVKVGDRGEALTRMAPIGKVLINEIIVEGKSREGFLDQKTPVEVIKVLNTQVIVKPIKEE